MLNLVFGANARHVCVIPFDTIWSTRLVGLLKNWRGGGQYIYTAQTQIDVT